MPAEPQNSAQVDCCASDGRILARIRLWPTRDTGLTGEAHPLVRWPEAEAQARGEEPVQLRERCRYVYRLEPLAGMTDAQWHGVIDVSLNGFFHVTQPLLLPMARTRWGRVVSVSSVAAVLGNRGQANYAAAKSALHGATKSLAREMASRGITANVIAPGVIRARDWVVEPDLSIAAVFLAAAAVTGGRVSVAGWPAASRP